MTHLTAADEAFQDACLNFVTAGREMGVDPTQHFADGVTALASVYGFIVQDLPSADRDVMWAELAEAAITAITDSRNALIEIKNDG